MTFDDIKRDFNFLIDKFGYELVKEERYDNKSEFTLVYSNRLAKRRIMIDYNGNPFPTVKVYRTSTPYYNLINKFNLGFSEYWISEYIEEISSGAFSYNDLIKKYEPDFFLKDYNEQAKIVTKLYQEILVTYLNDVISGKEWVNWERLRQ